MVKTILIDAMNTIFKLKDGITKYEMLQIFLIESLNEEIPIERIKEVYDIKREKYERWEGKTHLEKWTAINQEIILTLFPDITNTEAEKLGNHLAKRMASDASLYEVNRDTRAFLRQAKEREIEVIIASNQDPECINSLVKNFRLEKLLYEIYDSGRVGLEKPDPRFYERILESEGLSAKNCIMVGNNLKNDVLTAEEVGLRAGVLLDPRNLYPKHTGYKISKLQEIWHLDIFQRA